MIYPTEILREFVITVFRTAGAFASPEAETGLREVLTSPSDVRENARETVNNLDLWSHEQRVSIARALADKGLPSLVDVLIYFEGKEQKMLRAKKISDEAEYTIVKELLNGGTLTHRQQLKLSAMLQAYDDEIRSNPNSERAKIRNRR